MLAEEDERGRRREVAAEIISSPTHTEVSKVCTLMGVTEGSVAWGMGDGATSTTTNTGTSAAYRVML